MNHKSRFVSLFTFLLLLFLASCNQENEEKSYTSWSSYLGDDGRNHYTELDQITPGNVANLEVAWRYFAPDSGQMQMSPIIANGMVYGVTAGVQPFALDAKSGKEIWRFGDPLRVWHSTSRGVAYWEKGTDKRIFCTIGPTLYALNALTGEPIASFGNEGKIDLHLGLPEIAAEKFIVSNTPGTIFKDLIIMPVRLSEGSDAAPGDVRAFSTITGELVWTFHTIPYPDEEGYETWENPDTYKNSAHVGGGNNWAGMAVDSEREILYVPTGSSAPDFYGGDRKGENLFANTLLALNANTGEKVWHYQITHHDLWDRDLPAPPNLITVEINGKAIDAVAQVTKHGYVYLFDRETGEPLFDITEQPVPMSDLLGEQSWPTQPIPTKPKSFARQSKDLTVADISPYASNPDSLKAVFSNFNLEMYAPPATKPVLLLPGYDGGAEWGGAGADPKKGIVYVNANEMPWILQMEENTLALKGKSYGEVLYSVNCVVCHKQDRSGAPESNYPSLLNVSDRKSKEEAKLIISGGKGMMPGFTMLKEDDLTALLNYLYEEETASDKQEVADFNLEYQLPYKHMGYSKFLDSEGRPAINPPWGTLTAIDMNKGEFVWQIPLGYTEIDGENINTGTENYGGPIVTENGLLFIAATKDGYFRAIDRMNGKILFETKLPAASFSSPATYMIDGKQYIVMACGGEKLGTPKGNQIIAFALPE